MRPGDLLQLGAPTRGSLLPQDVTQPRDFEAMALACFIVYPYPNIELLWPLARKLEIAYLHLRDEHLKFSN